MYAANEARQTHLQTNKAPSGSILLLMQESEWHRKYFTLIYFHIWLLYISVQYDIDPSNLLLHDFFLALFAEYMHFLEDSVVSDC